MFFDEEAAVSELQALGYRVIKVDFSESTTVSNIKELVKYFYATRQFYNPDRRFPLSLNYNQDIKFISGFVKKRQELGLSRKGAIQEVAVLIVNLFKFEEHLKLKEPALSPKILEISYIMDRVCSFANGEVAEANETDTNFYIDEVNQAYNKKFADTDFEKADEDRRVILEGLDG